MSEEDKNFENILHIVEFNRENNQIAFGMQVCGDYWTKENIRKMTIKLNEKMGNNNVVVTQKTDKKYVQFLFRLPN